MERPVRSVGLSYQFDSEFIEVITRKGEILNKPHLILEYNKFMEGIYKMS